MSPNGLGFSRVSIAFTRCVSALPMPWVARMTVAVMFLAAMMLMNAAMASGSRDVLKPFEHFQDCDICSEMIVLPAGKFMMGGTEEEFRGQDQYRFMYFDETPRHEAEVKSFALAKYVVTRKQFEIFANETGFQGKGCHILNGKKWAPDATADWRNPGFRQTDQDPVVCVSWEDAQKYIAWLNSKLSRPDGKQYRLPTETEWEYATRAGTTTAMYWGNNHSDQCKYENARDIAAKILNPAAPYADCNDGYVETAPVGSFRPNPWGFFDMMGNAKQWMGDCPFVNYLKPPAVPTGSNTVFCGIRAVRGGSWASIPIGIRAAFRSAAKPAMRNSGYGFRLAIDVPQ
jgi:formylglycine-generating enzyme required for sulfatase activity